MLLGWLTFTAVLVATVSLAVAGVTVKPFSRVRGQAQEELTLHCGDRQRSGGVVLFWHSPFGFLYVWDPHNSQKPVNIRHDGSLIISNSSAFHNGLYYCLLWRRDGSSLWQYQLQVDAFRVSQEVRVPEDRPETGPPKEKPEDGTEGKMAVRSQVVLNEDGMVRVVQVGQEEEPEDGSEFKPPQEENDDGLEVQSGEGGTTGVPDDHFAAAVAASVLLTFMVGFTAGALSRTHILRCLQSVTKRLRSLRQRACQHDTTDHGSEVTMATVSQALEMGRMGPDGSWASTPSPPAKPQRSFRYKREEENEAAAYLEGCDHVRTAGGGGGEREDWRKEEVEESEEGRNEEEEDEEEESEANSFFLLGDDGGSQSETEEERGEEVGGSKRGEDGESRKDGDGGIREREDGWRKEEDYVGSREKGGGGSKKEEDGGSSKERNEEGEGETSQFSHTLDEGNHTERNEEEKRSEGKSEDEEGDGGADGGGASDQSSDGDGDGDGDGDARVSPVAPRPARRVIRLYQYDEDGRRYSHLPDAPAEAPGPAPRLKQRSLSLTRLNAIMAAATASPLDASGDGEEKPRFYMDI